MMLTVWIAVGVGALLFLAVLGFGLFGQVKRLRTAFADAQTAVGPHVQELTEGIRRAQTLRMQAGTETTRGHGRHA
ncbi:MAG: hypothetical protein M3313_15480 [Actinomycetota bacterium]|nr:hypothetical protein [Actinomycetota bacterium]